MMRLRIATAILLLGAAACRTASQGNQPLAPKDNAEEGSVSTAFTSEDWRARPPEPGPSPKLTFPRIQTLTLDNGIPVYLVEGHARPLVVVRVVIRAGSSSDPPRRAGLAQFVATLVPMARAGRSALSASDEIENIGGTLSSGAAQDSSFVMLDCLCEHLAASLDLLAAVLVSNEFDAQQFERRRAEAVAEIRKQRDTGILVAQSVLHSLAYGAQHPYAHSIPGTEDSIHRFTRRDVIDFHRTYWTPRNVVISVVGDVTAEEVKESLNQKLATWNKPLKPKQPSAVPAGSNGGLELVLVDSPGSSQASVAIGHVGPPRGSPDWGAATVMSRALGGYFGSRITQRIRVAKGYTYTSSSTILSSSMGPGLVSIRNAIGLAQVAAAIREILNEVTRMQTEPVSGQELEVAKALSTDGVATRLQSNQQIAAALDDSILFGGKTDFFDRDVSMIQSLKPEDVRKAAFTYLPPNSLKIVVVAPAAKVEKELVALGLGELRRETLADALRISGR